MAARLCLTAGAMVAIVAGCAAEPAAIVRPAVPPFVPTDATAAAVTPWATPVNGLTARIEDAQPTLGSLGYVDGYSVFVRVRNVGDVAMIVPVAGCGGAGSPFAVLVGEGDRWRPLPPRDGEPSSIELATLAPGEDALCAVTPVDPAALNRSEAARAVLSADGSLAKNAWSGTLRTPARFVHIDPPAAGAEPLPGRLPALNRSTDSGPSAPVRKFLFGTDQSFINHERHNAGLLAELTLYRPAEVRDALDPLLATEADPQMRIVLAAEAAARGSAVGRAYLIGLAADTDAEIVTSRAEALGRLMGSGPTPDWVVEQAVGWLHDSRPTRPAGVSASTVKMTEGRSALLSALADAQTPLAVPALTALAREPGGGGDVVLAVCWNNDRRWVPLLTEFADRIWPEWINVGEYITSPPNVGAALLRLQPSARNAVGRLDVRLLQSAEFKDWVAREQAIERLGKSGDERAAGPLLTAIRSNPDRRAESLAAEALGGLPYPAAVDGLIDLLDAPLPDPDRPAGKEPHLEDIRDAMAASLRRLTGQPFGTDAARWRAWRANAAGKPAG